MTMNSVPLHSLNPSIPRFGVKQEPKPTIAQVLEKFMQGYDRRVPEHGQFPAGYEVPFRYKGHLVVFKVGGFISDPEFYDRRYFEVLVKTPSGNSNSKAWLFRGSKQELESLLKASDAENKVRIHIDQAIDSLQDKKYS